MFKNISLTGKNNFYVSDHKLLLVHILLWQSARTCLDNTCSLLHTLCYKICHGTQLVFSFKSRLGSVYPVEKRRNRCRISLVFYQHYYMGNYANRTAQRISSNFLVHCFMKGVREFADWRINNSNLPFRASSHLLVATSSVFTSIAIQTLKKYFLI